MSPPGTLSPIGEGKEKFQGGGEIPALAKSHGSKSNACAECTLST